MKLKSLIPLGLAGAMSFLSPTNASAAGNAKVSGITQSLGLRNNNPGNIRISGDKWMGAIGNDGKFVKFASPEYGIRALAHNLKSYQTLHGLNTIKSIIKRWAPKNENFTSRYIRFVAHKMGKKTTEELDLNKVDELLALVDAVIDFENSGNPYDDATMKKAISMK
jgi:hypothetical protein